MMTGFNVIQIFCDMSSIHKRGRFVLLIGQGVKQKIKCTMIDRFKVRIFIRKHKYKLFRNFANYPFDIIFKNVLPNNLYLKQKYTFNSFLEFEIFDDENIFTFIINLIFKIDKYNVKCYS